MKLLPYVLALAIAPAIVAAVPAPGFGQSAYQRYIRKKVERDKIDARAKAQIANNYATAYRGYGAMAEMNRRQGKIRGYYHYRKLQASTTGPGILAQWQVEAAEARFLKDRERCRRVRACK